MARKVAAKTEQGLPPGLVKALAKSAGAGIDSGGLLEALIECWGGRKAFARDIFKEFQAGKSGGMTRQRILEMISRLTVQVTAQDLAKPRGPADMSDDELVQTAKIFVERMQQGGPTAGP